MGFERLRNVANSPSKYALGLDESSITANIKIACRYAYSESLKGKYNFMVGFSTIFLVIVSITLLYNIGDSSALLFLRLSEISVGEVDLLFTSRSGNLLNFTSIEKSLLDEPETEGLSPRWIIFASVSTSGDRLRTKEFDPIRLKSKYIKENSLNENIHRIIRNWIRFYDLVVRSMIPKFILKDSFIEHSNLYKNIVRDTSHSLNKNDKIYGIGNNIIGGSYYKSDNNNNNNSTNYNYNSEYEISCLVLIINSTQEKMASIGRSWKYPPINGFSCYVGESLKRSLDVERGDSISLKFNPLVSIASALGYSDLSKFLLDIVNRFGIPLDYGVIKEIVRNHRKYFDIKYDFTIEDFISSPDGKYQVSYGSAVILEAELVQSITRDIIKSIYQHEINRVFTNINTNLQVAISDFLKSREIQFIPSDFSLNDHAMVILAIKKSRFSDYCQERNQLKKRFLDWSNSIRERTPKNEIYSLSSPLLYAMKIMNYLKLLLDQILLITSIFFISIGSFLIYSLMLLNVEEKIQELSVLRSLGAKRNTLIILVCVQSLLFSVPANIIAIIFSFFLWMIVRRIMISFIASNVSILLSPTSIYLSASIGFLIPIISTIAPTRVAINGSLRESIDNSFDNNGDTKVDVKKIEDVGLSSLELTISVFSILIGAIIYYFIPNSFLNMKYELFFNLFVVIILFFLLGLLLIVSSVQFFFNIIILNSIMWFSERYKLKRMVEKNIYSHYWRNSKTLTLFMSCVFFVIFCNSIFLLQSRNINTSIKILVGSDITIDNYARIWNFPINEREIRAYLDSWKMKHINPIKSYSFSTFDLSSAKHVKYIDGSNLIEVPRIETSIYGVEENFLESIFDEYTEFTSVDNRFEYNLTRNKNYNVIPSLFKYPRSSFDYGKSGGSHVLNATSKLEDDFDSDIIPVIFTHSRSLELGIRAKDPFVLLIANNDLGEKKKIIETYKLCSIRATCSKLSGYIFSGRNKNINAITLVSIESFSLISRYVSKKFNLNQIEDGTPKKTLYIKLKDGTDNNVRIQLVNELKSYIDSEYIQLNDVKDILAYVSDAVLFLQILSGFVMGITMLLCFFVLLICFTSNIHQNIWEFGLSRAIGLTKNQVIRVYIYEAIILVASSIVIGTIVGFVFTITLVLESNFFTESSFEIDFPVLPFLGFLIMGSIIAFLSSWIPANSASKKGISDTLKK